MGGELVVVGDGLVLGLMILLDICTPVLHHFLSRLILMITYDVDGYF